MSTASVPGRCRWALLLGVAAVAVTASAGPIEVIYTEIAGDPTAIVPGARDANGNLVYAEFTALQELALRPDGGEWVVKATSNLASTLDAILIRGAGTSGTALAQDGQPVQGGLPSEKYDFFDSPVPAAWDTAGNLAFSFRAKGGSSSTFEKVVVVSGGVHTIVVQMGDPALGLVDQPPNPSGDELLGNSINSVHLLDTGEVAYVNTPIQNCHSNRYPAFFRGHTSFRQSGVSPIGTIGELWDSFDYDDCGGTANGHWYAKGDTDTSTTMDDILAVDDVIVLREGSPVAGSSVIMSAIFFTRMAINGDWFCRGDDPSDNDWAVRSGVLVAKTGDAITPTEHWGNTFVAFNGNKVGDWALAGNTDEPEVNRDNVLVLNGTEILIREGDAIDLDGNGLFDDDVYLASFQPNDLFITDDRVVYFLATLRNGAGTSLGDAFLRKFPESPVVCPGDGDCDGHIGFGDIDYFVAAIPDNAGAWAALYAARHGGAQPPCPFLNNDCNGDGHVNFADIDPFVALIPSSCP